MNFAFLGGMSTVTIIIGLIYLTMRTIVGLIRQIAILPMNMAHLGPKRTTGAISVGYFYHPSWINGRFTVGASISYSGFSEDIKSSLTGTTMGSIKEYNLAFTPSLRYAWIAKPVFQLYSGIAISLYYNDYKANVEMRLTSEAFKNSDLKTSFQVTPLGLSIGKDIFVFGEVNLGGRTGLFVTGGGYRF